MQLLSLHDLIDESGEEIANEILSSFCISRNPDVEHFIRKQAVSYEKSNNARSFIFVNETGKPLGFMSLALTTLTVPENISASLKKRLRGFGRFSSENVPCYLIGQLARLDPTDREELSGDAMFAEVAHAVETARRMFGGRIVSVDCIDELVDYYKDRGFTPLNKIDDLNQMVYLIREDGEPLFDRRG